MISTPKFWSSEIYVVTLNFQENIFYPFSNVSGKTSSEMECKSIIFFVSNHGGVKD